MSPARGRHQHGLTLAERCVGVAAGVEHELEHFGVASERRFVQWREAETVREVRIAAFAEQPLHGADVVTMRGPMQR